MWYIFVFHFMIMIVFLFFFLFFFFIDAVYTVYEKKNGINKENISLDYIVFVN